MEKKSGKNPKEVMFTNVGSIIGIVIVCAAMFLVPLPVGAIPGAFLGILGAVVGGLCGKAIAKLTTK